MDATVIDVAVIEHSSNCVPLLFLFVRPSYFRFSCSSSVLVMDLLGILLSDGCCYS